MRGGDANRQRLSRFLPPHPLIHHQGHATLELHNGLGRDGFDLENIQMESVMQQREHLALHARRDHSGLAFHLDSFTLPDDPVADFQTEGLFPPGVHSESDYLRCSRLFESLPRAVQLGVGELFCWGKCCYGTEGKVVWSTPYI